MQQSAAKMQSKCSQNAANIKSKCSQNAVKIESKCSQNAAKMQLIFRQNAAIFYFSEIVIRFISGTILFQLTLFYNHFGPILRSV